MVQRAAAWLSFTFVLALIFVLIEANNEVSFLERLGQKLQFMLILVPPVLVVGYSVLARTSEWSTIPRRLAIGSAGALSAGIITSVIVFYLGPMYGIIPHTQANDPFRTIVTTMLVSSVISLVAMELEHKPGIITAPNSPPEKFYSLKFRDRVMRLSLDDIVYIATKRNYCYLFLESGQEQTKQTLASILQELDDPNFVKIHKQYAVNFIKIREIRHTSGGSYLCYLNDSEDTSLPIGRTYLPQLRDRFLQAQKDAAVRHL